MKICKANLDKKINDKFTLYKYIKKSEERFNMTLVNLYLMKDSELEQYYSFIEYLWKKD